MDSLEVNCNFAKLRVDFIFIQENCLPAARPRTITEGRASQCAMDSESTSHQSMWFQEAVTHPLLDDPPSRA